ncbi:hypothetical protein ACSBOX_12205 [Arthrobacter sp. KN11-1C]|uniref:hypothetical protein n=1 Tax=Arthrobacter sp. KN11-1C TaxID=3445774 RepID=UPI003FA0FE3D
MTPDNKWSSFKAGDLVEVWSDGVPRYSAQVDDHSEDGEMVWIIETRTAARRLLLRSDNVALYRLSA